VVVDVGGVEHTIHTQEGEESLGETVMEGGEEMVPELQFESIPAAEGVVDILIQEINSSKISNLSFHSDISLFDHFIPNKSL